MREAVGPDLGGDGCPLAQDLDRIANSFQSWMASPFATATVSRGAEADPSVATSSLQPS
jgi:hypothetical protein